MKPIYKPSGRAKEYGDYAINIYTGCPHRCYYCFAPSVLRKDKETFHSCIEPRKGIVEAVKRQLDNKQITGALIHLCFTCDPYPNGYDSTATREIIKAIKQTGNHVQILTKNGVDARGDFDLLDGEDWFGVTWCGYPSGALFKAQDAEPGAGTEAERLSALDMAHKRGIKTWMSIEPVIDAAMVLEFLDLNVRYIDKYKIGKMNYHPSSIDWKAYGVRAERICRNNGLNYYIKDDLRKAMEAPDETK